MRIEDFSSKNWEALVSEMQEVNYLYRRFLCIRSHEEIEWFERESDAEQRGYSLIRYRDIQEIANRCFSDPVQRESFLERGELLTLSQQGRRLLDFPSRDPYQYVDIASQISAVLKKHQEGFEPYLSILGKQLYLIAESLFLEQNNIEEIYSCRAAQVDFLKEDRANPLYHFEQKVASLSKHYPHPAMAVEMTGVGNIFVKMFKIKAWIKDFETKQIDQISFKVSYPCRQRIKNEIEILEKNLDACRIKFENVFSSITLQHANEQFFVSNKEKFSSSESLVISREPDMLQIDFENLGTLRIGLDEKIACSYNKITIETPSNLQNGEFLARAQRMLSVIGMTELLETTPWDNKTKMSRMFMYHTYFPSEAYELENEEFIAICTPDELEQEICRRTPSMQEVFEFYRKNHKIGKWHFINRNYLVPGLQDIALKIRAKGGIGLIHGISGNTVDVPRVFSTIMQTGCLSTEDRFESGFFTRGASSLFDYSNGGGDSVFTRLITKQMINSSASLENTFRYTYGNVFLLIDLTILNKGGYAYPIDRCGQRNRFSSTKNNNYKNRNNFWETTDTINELSNPKELPFGKWQIDNEFMIKNRIPPNFIVGVLSENKEIIKNCFDELKKKNLVRYDKDGNAMINDIPYDEFFHVGDAFEEKMWNKNENLFR